MAEEFLHSWALNSVTARPIRRTSLEPFFRRPAQIGFQFAEGLFDWVE